VPDKRSLRHDIRNEFSVAITKYYMDHLDVVRDEARVKELTDLMLSVMDKVLTCVDRYQVVQVEDRRAPQPPPATST
jgi:hypothetical protein